MNIITICELQDNLYLYIDLRWSVEIRVFHGSRLVTGLILYFSFVPLNIGKRGKNKNRGEDGRFISTPAEDETLTNSSSLSEAVTAIVKSTKILLALTVAQQQSSGTAVSSTLSAMPVLPAPSASHKFTKWECKLKYEDRSYAGRLKIVSSFEDHLKQQPSATPKVVASAFRSGLESFPNLHNLVAELPAPYRNSYEYLKTKILKALEEKEEKHLLNAFHSLATLSSSQHADAEQFENAVETVCQRITTLSLREEHVCVYKSTGDPDNDANWKVVRQQVPLLDPLGRRDGQLACLLLINGISDQEVHIQSQPGVSVAGKPPFRLANPQSGCAVPPQPNCTHPGHKAEHCLKQHFCPSCFRWGHKPGDCELAKDIDALLCAYGYPPRNSQGRSGTRSSRQKGAALTGATDFDMEESDDASDSNLAAAAAGRMKLASSSDSPRPSFSFDGLGCMLDVGASSTTCT
uniref:Uncharacterized protein n=1 Tax=Chromera velia CCMP2878 TaxID=1169474 RepID=A0A0K6SBI2_9ALVE|eukprot:Cvel_13799.t1-p1 / transcript=Cvel_13799.t1 / gene=Cvel_13799 / organism=Chromera_velia_CCMP2878 / gene_product=hypothetical protein / transcript_product=hypothetical protein / location=Cvel_scaffold957:10170-11681(-) / protein_length=462 / sequence_SO=supercontig / SO=protein_coding / is_pseudo=false